MPVIYHVLLVLVVGLHVCWVLVVVSGALLALAGQLHRLKYATTGYLAVVGVTVLGDIVYRGCPLTALELRFRALAGYAVTSQGFVERILNRFMGPIAPETVTMLGVTVLSLGLLGIIFWNAMELRHANA